MTTKSKARPTHSVFVVQGEGEAAKWFRVGACWPCQDGNGFTVKLDAMPFIGRVVIRENKERTATTGGQQ